MLKTLGACAVVAASLLTRATNAAAIALVIACVALVIALLGMWRIGDFAKLIKSAIDEETGRFRPPDDGSTPAHGG